jgi:isoleucyl-tRNA synthetase
MNYKDTLNLPKTSFSMKANLVQKEPDILKYWDENKVYSGIRQKMRGKEKCILHDGPPYANGHIHMGHVLNKILKDIVVKFYTMKGFDSPFVPGWDCHGLPVEHQLFKELNISKTGIDQNKFRKRAKNYALKFVEIQKREFERLGVFGDWGKPYLTLDPKYEAQVIRSFGKLVQNGYVYRDLKPVNWCMNCETALAEAEVEYRDHESPSIYVKFMVKGSKRLAANSYFIIWTTTPWTLLGNVAIALHPDLEYVIIEESEGEKWVMLDALLEVTMKKLKKRFEIKGRLKGSELEGTECRHPFLDRLSRVVLADYVSKEEGTGCVHTAPGHGQEDYITGKKYSLPMIMPVGSKGTFDKTCGEFSEMKVYEANPRIIERLKEEKALLLAEGVSHSYPHCWRCKEPIIFRATKQYFASIDHKSLREKMLRYIGDRIKWYPEEGKSRISAMVENRPDWCLSRQRYWGVPIVAFKCKKCEEALLDGSVINRVADLVEKTGSDTWFEKDAGELLPKDFPCKNCGSSDFTKETDIVDVWFESGVSHQSVLKGMEALDFPCELYLEGSDQHRGWFQSSLITSSAIDDKPPYRAVLTHGFTVDGDGKKMSKSLGNVVSPQELMKKYGADILRLWVSSANYQDDIRISEEILNRLADAYRKIRNTFRYLLGNVHDYDPDKNSVQIGSLLEIDRWMLSRLSGVIKEVEQYYADYLFYKVYRCVYNFCVYEVSSLYLDILKDRLYTFGQNSIERRSCQTVLYEILIALLKILAPILSFTTEEAWRSLFPGRDSIHLCEWGWDKKTLASWSDAAMEEKWSRLLSVREEVLKALEEKRISGEIGSSLEARLVLYSDKKEISKFLKENMNNLTSFFITSQVKIADKVGKNARKCPGSPIWISVEKAQGKKCSRCWNYKESVGENREFNDICARCAEVVSALKGV